MFINDDGLQIIDEEERQARIDFYADHSIGWTARPKHGKDGFTRKGKFKKVSQLISLVILSLSYPSLQLVSRPPYEFLYLSNQGLFLTQSATKVVPVIAFLPHSLGGVANTAESCPLHE